MDMGADVCRGAVCRGAQLPVAADACSVGVRCVGDYDSRPSVCTLIRPEVCRLRPSNPENPLSEMVHIVGGYRGGSYGFPSCHAANSFALASFLTLLFANRKLSLFIFAWAVLNSYSRVYLGVHYPGDLLVGAIIGTAAGLAMAFAAGYVADRVDRPHLKPSVNTGVVTSVGAFTVAVIAVVSCFVRM